MNPKFDLRLNPPYLVDYSALGGGKRMGVSKKKVQWRFGFSNAEAIRDGRTGIECRGEEHQVNLQWSLASGKRIITADGREVHFSQGRRTETRFEASWTMAGGHVLKVIAHATGAIRENPGFRQFDLTLDGMSVHDMPKIYELGKVRGTGSCRRAASDRHFATPSPQRYGEDYGYSNFDRSYDSLPASHETYGNDQTGYARRSYSTSELYNEQQVAAAPSSIETVQVPADLVSEPTPIAGVHDHLATPAPLLPANVAYVPPATPVAASPVPHAGYPPFAPPPAPVVYQPHDEFAPVVPVQTYENKMSEILSAYGASPTQPALPMITNGEVGEQPPAPQPPVTPEQKFFADNRNQSSLPYEQFDAVTHASPTSVANVVPEGTRNELQKALSNLVNLEDITEEADSPEKYKLTMAKQEEEKKKSGKSQPLPPKKTFLGSGASLADIRQHAQQKAPPTKEIMRTPTFDPNVSKQMLVVYGQQGGISFQQGFGAGTRLSTYNAFGQPFASHA